MNSLEQRFWKKVEKGSECWLWTGGIKSKEHPYGKMFVGKKYQRAHRISWELHNGSIPEGMHVLHKCDNPRCVRPDHLFLGNHAQNMEDMISKGRKKACSGEAWHKAHAGTFQTGDNHYLRKDPSKAKRGEECLWTKLTEEKVIEIRKIYDSYSNKTGLLKKLAKEYRVHDTTIMQIVNGKVWKHLACSPTPDSKRGPKLTRNQAMEIKTRCLKGEKSKDLAVEFCVSQSLVHQIAKGTAWSSLSN